MRRANKTLITPAVTAALAGKEIEHDGRKLRIVWIEHHGGGKWGLLDADDSRTWGESACIVTSSNLEGLEAAFKAHVRKVKTKGFEREKVIVFSSGHGLPMLAEVTSRPNEDHVWVVKENDSKTRDKLYVGDAKHRTPARVFRCSEDGRKRLEEIAGEKRRQGRLLDHPQCRARRRRRLSRAGFRAARVRARSTAAALAG